MRRTIRLRLYGIVFVVVVALLLSLSVAVYQQAFTPVVRITLEADTLGNQLEPRADVKLRGLLVGEVREVRADGEKATLGIALKPEHVPLIPADVHARLLPKTLFGEKYVDLVAPAGSGRQPARHIRAGDVITQDRTTVGIELQRLMNDLLPLLRTVQPAKLNATLSAFSTALEGRGEDIGDNLTRLDAYLRRLNPHMPSLKEDISRFADVAEVYGEAAPDLLRILDNTLTTSRTIVEKREQLSSFLTWTATAANTTEGVLDENSARLITLGRVSRPTLALFARYSPEYPCLLAGLVRQEADPPTDPARNRAMPTAQARTAEVCPTPMSRHPRPSSTTVRRRRRRTVQPAPYRAHRPNSTPSPRSWPRSWACPPTRSRPSRPCSSARWHEERR
jgi:virulence factor Mce-like protein